MVKTETENKVLAWHFVSATLRDGRPIPPDNVPLHQDGPIVLCKNGLHGSERLIDAMKYVPGYTLCRTEHGGKILSSYDKLASSVRTILWRIDATEVLRAFARRCALDVAHLWDMPEVVRRYLETGDGALWKEARAAARESVPSNKSTNAAKHAAAAAKCAISRGSIFDIRHLFMNAAVAVGCSFNPDGFYAGEIELKEIDRQNALLTSMVEAEHEKQTSP